MMNLEKIDYEIVLQSICSYFCIANSFGYLPKIKRRYNFAFMPSISHLYSGALKSATYSRFNKKKKLFIICQGTDNEGISVFDGDISFMGKCWNFNFGVFGKYSEYIKNTKKGFEFIFGELPFVRIIKDYDYVFFLRIGKHYKNGFLLSFFNYLSNIGNLVFLSDLHKDLPFEKCQEMDDFSFNMKKKSDIYLLSLFFSLSDVQNRRVKIIGYENTALIDGNKNSTIGYCSLVF